MVGRVESAVQNCSRLVTDFAPKSAKIVRASITNESAGAPRAGTAGTRKRVARMICDESLMALGTVTRNRLCADGTPPTASVESIGAAGGANTKVARAAYWTVGVRATDVPTESTRRYHWRLSNVP